MQANAQVAPGRTFERTEVVRALTGRKVPVSIVHAFSPNGAELAILERYELEEAKLAMLEQDARRAMTLRHPNIAQIRDVWRDGAAVVLISEFVEGETLEELRRLTMGKQEIPLEVGVRVVVDLLSALSAMHTHGAGPETRGLAHGEVTASNAIVGFDGITRLVRPARGRIAGSVAEGDWFGYVAPEILRDAPADSRSDLFSVGVLLWETLSRRKLFPKATREGRARPVPIGKPTPPPDATWATPLVAVTERALAMDPAGRYASAAEMAAALRLAVRSKLAMPPRVAAMVDRTAGEKILQRRMTCALPEAPTKPGHPSVRPSIPPEAVRMLEAMRPSSRPPTPKPGPVAVVHVPKAPPVPTITAEARVGPRPAAPQLKLPTPAMARPIPKPIAKPVPGIATAIEPEPISLGALIVAEVTEFGNEAPTVPKDRKTAPPVPHGRPITAAPADVVAPPPEVMAALAEPIVATAPVPTPELDGSSITAPAPRREEDVAPAALVPAGLSVQRGRRALIGVAAFCGLVLFGVVVRFALPSSPTKPSTTASVASHAPQPTALSTQTTIPTAGTARTTTDVAASSQPVAPETSASGTTAAPEGSRHRTRPRPTYDPMGI